MTDEIKKFSINNFCPQEIFRPETESELADIFKAAHRDNNKLLVLGTNSQRHFGRITEPYQKVISTVNLNSIVEHDVSNLTITVQTGVKLRQLQDEVKGKNQFLPLDAVGRNESTIGGIVAMNSTGPLRFRYGACKDIILGMGYVLPDGTAAKSGGKTVKNVAGYDLYKLFIGSCGALGAITQITFKLYPAAKVHKIVKIDFSNYDNCDGFLKNLLHSPFVFSSLDLWSPNILKSTGYLENTSIDSQISVLVGLEGERPFVDSMIYRLNDVVKMFDGARMADLAQAYWEEFHKLSFQDNNIILRAAVPLTKVVESIRIFEKYAYDNNIEVSFYAHAGVGIIQVHYAIGERNLPLSPMVEFLRSGIKQLGGNLIVHSLPYLSDEAIDFWGASRSELLVAEKIKRQFDPHHIIAAGRLVGGL